MSDIEVKRDKRLPFTCVDNRMIEDERAKCKHKSVYMSTCYYADSNGECFPSYSSIAKKAGVSRRTAIESIEDLVEWQYLSKVKRKREGTNSQTSNLYLILSEVVQEMHQGGARAALGVVQELHPNKNHINKTQLTTLFDRFWSTYPRKVKKPNAFKAWLKIKPDKQLTEEIIEGVEKYKQTEGWKQEDGKFIPHPATFLNGRQWEDEIDVESESECPFE